MTSVTHIKTNTQMRRDLTEATASITGTRFCIRCSRLKDATTGVLKKDGLGRARWTCFGCNQSWKSSKSTSKKICP
jgi:hypothetical protein